MTEEGPNLVPKLTFFLHTHSHHKHLDTNTWTDGARNPSDRGGEVVGVGGYHRA